MAEKEEEQKGPEIKQIPGLPPSEKEALGASSGAEDAALKEEKQLSSGRTEADLKAEAAEKEHKRKQGFLDLFETLVKIGMMVAFVGIVIMGAVWVWHLITPCKLQWLTEQQIDHIQGMVTGGVIAVVVGDHFKRRLGKDD